MGTTTYTPDAHDSLEQIVRGMLALARSSESLVSARVKGKMVTVAPTDLVGFVTAELRREMKLYSVSA